MQSSMTVLKFIRSEVAAKRPFPSPAAICRHMGWSGCSPARDCLTRLTRHGHLKVTNRERKGNGWVYQYELMP